MYPKLALPAPITIEVAPIPADALPISLNMIREHTHVEDDETDELLGQYLRASVEAFENTTHRTIVSRAHAWTLRDFPRGYRQDLKLPRGRTTEIANIKFMNAGAQSTLTTSDFQFRLSGDMGAQIRPLYGQQWPTVDWTALAPVEIAFTAGYTADDLPPAIVQYLLFSVRCELDDFRGSVDPAKYEKNTQLLETLASGWRLPRVYA